MAVDERKFIPDVVAFALAGVALVALVVDEIDVPHDDWKSAGILAAGAVAGVVAWSLGGKRRERASQLAWDAVRLVLAFEMVRYGMGKIVGMQFYPRYGALDTRAVELKPGGLAWTFFGHGYGYQAIGGVIEAGSGVLVAFRRTTLLGACLMATALVNVVLVDFFYDVPVKLFSSLYLALDLSLVARDAPRLRALFLPPAPSVAPAGSRTARVAGGVLVALALLLPTGEIVEEASAMGVFHEDRLEGLWTVDHREGLDDLLPQAPGAWDRVILEKAGRDAEGHLQRTPGAVRVGKTRLRFVAQVDDAAGTLRLAFDGPDAPTLEGHFDLEGRRLHMAGRDHAGHPFALDLTREYPR